MDHKQERMYCLSHPLAVTTKPPPMYPHLPISTQDLLVDQITWSGESTKGAHLHFFRKSDCPLPDPDQHVSL